MRFEKEKLESQLFYEIINRNVKKIFELVNKGVSVKAKDVFGLSALHYAAQVGIPEVVSFFIEKGANLNEKHEGSGMTPLHVACENYSDCESEERRKEMLKTIEILVNEGANVNARDIQKRTPLHYAACSGSAKAVKLLANAKADLDAVEESGMTPLHVACFMYDVEEKKLKEVKNRTRFEAENFLETIRTLVECGARVDVLDKNKKFALDYLNEKNPARAFLENELRKQTNVIKFKKRE